MSTFQIRPSCRLIGIAASFALLVIVGCGQSSNSANSDKTSPSADSAPVDSAPVESVPSKSAPVGANQTNVGAAESTDANEAKIQFKDSVVSNVEVPRLDNLAFVDTNGDRVVLSSYLGKKNIVLVFTEGFAGGMLCPFCKTQTSRLVANYDRFEELDTKVLVVYPGARDHLEEFIEAAKTTEKKQVSLVPFPLLLDEKLEAVKFFNISSNLAHPSTFIIDKQGNVKLAYVGADMTADRPSISAMLNILSEAEAQAQKN